MSHKRLQDFQGRLMIRILSILICAFFLPYSFTRFNIFNPIKSTHLSLGFIDHINFQRDSLLTRALPDVDDKKKRSIDCYIGSTLETEKIIDFCPSARRPTSKWREFKKRPFRIGTLDGTGLEGCTVVVIVTKHGVWMAHFWEVPGFGPSPKFPPGDPRYGQEDFKSERFQQDVLDYIKNGIATANPAEYPPRKDDKLGEHKDKLQDANIWILSPTPPGKKTGFLYPSKIEQLERALEAEVGKAKKIHYLQYEKPKPKDLIQVLFEYDPSPKKRIRLLYSGHLAFDSTFT